MQCFTFDCPLRGYHVYKNIWTPNLSDNLQVRLCQNVISCLLDIQFLPQADPSTTSRLPGPDYLLYYYARLLQLLYPSARS